VNAASRRVRRRYIAVMTEGRRKMAATNNAHVQQAKLPFVKTNDRGRISNWWNVKPTGKWVEDFRIGRRHAFKFWEVCGSRQTFALEFQQIILGMLSAAKNPRAPTSYSGIEAGFLLAVGELSRGAIHVQTLLQDNDASERRTRRMGVSAASGYTPNDWEFGVSHSD
jgi:hypothetical protein